MASDQHVTARMVLQAQLELERRGPEWFTRYLEQSEPDLANFVLETLSLVHQKLSHLCGPPRRTQKAFRQVQTLLIVSLEAQRRAQLELWGRQMGSALEQLDPEGPEHPGLDSCSEP